MLSLSNKLPAPNIDYVDHNGIQCILVEIELDSQVIQSLDKESLTNDIEFYHDRFEGVNIHFHVTAVDIPDVLVESLKKLTNYDGGVIVTHGKNTSADNPITIRNDLVKAINEFSSSSGSLWNPVLKSWCNPVNR